MSVNLQHLTKPVRVEVWSHGNSIGGNIRLSSNVSRVNNMTVRCMHLNQDVTHGIKLEPSMLVFIYGPFLVAFRHYS